MNKLISCLFLLIFISCQEFEYYSYQPVDSTGWDKNDTLVYTLDTPLNTNDSFSFQIGIRHKDTYKYRDIWLTINQDTVHFYLADSIGRWNGSGISGLCQITLPFYPTFSQKDSIKDFRITHIMQDNPLPDIHDIGISIKKSY